MTRQGLQAAGLALMLTIGAFGCYKPGPRVRVATATQAELEAVRDQNNVWYEFQPGDTIPVQFLFFGAIEGGSEQSAVFRAKRQVFFVMFKNSPMRISFDGKSLAGPFSSQSIIGIVPRKDGPGAEIGWLIYMGESADAEGELRKTIQESK